MASFTEGGGIVIVSDITGAGGVTESSEVRGEAGEAEGEGGACLAADITGKADLVGSVVIKS